MRQEEVLQSVMASLRVPNLSYPQIISAVDTLISTGILLPLPDHIQEVFEILDHQNWRVPLEFLTSCADYRIAWDHPVLFSKLWDLLNHKEDYVFLASMRTLLRLGRAREEDAISLMEKANRLVYPARKELLLKKLSGLKKDF
jgi:hypothetical protein